MNKDLDQICTVIDNMGAPVKTKILLSVGVDAPAWHMAGTLRAETIRRAALRGRSEAEAARLLTIILRTLV